MAGSQNGDAVNIEQPQHFNARELERAKKRRRSRSPANSSSRRSDSRNSGRRSRSPPRSSNDAYRSRRSPLPAPRRRSPTPPQNRGRSPTPPRKQKRPGQRARITESEQQRIKEKQLEREKEQEAYIARSGIHDAVKQHYNAVPERGRDWRKTDSKIKGLRSFNNWVKSTIIQKFSPQEDYTPGAQERGDRGIDGGPSSNGLLVLDIGCGKGGDLGKWQKAPQPVELYVGLDPANISIEQARDRYHDMQRRGRGGGRGGRGGYGGRSQAPLFQGEFFTQDCFGESIASNPIVQEVGFDGSGGPSRGGRGFDVVSMMFCLHYSFESEEKARIMLRNVAGSLKKGGKLIGCIPNSDFLSKKVVEFNKKQAEAAKNGNEEVKDEGEVEEGEADDTASWGNDVYRVRFAGKTPADGIFRPPFGWKYNFFLHEAVEEVPEYVVPWEAFRAIAEDYNLEMQYHKTFDEVWETEKDDAVLGPLSEQMGVRERGGGPLLVSPEEMEAASFYSAFCFYKV